MLLCLVSTISVGWNGLKSLGEQLDAFHACNNHDLVAWIGTTEGLFRTNQEAMLD